MSLESEKESFYRGGKFNYQLIGGIAAIAMVALSVYLTKHYFDVKFPTGLQSSGLCNINSFFNCDVATASPLSNILGVPISLVGLFLGLFTLFGYLFNNSGVEKTVHTLLWINAIGCALLFIYSLVALGGLCPACTLYYIASFIVLFCFHKSSDFKGIDALSLGGFGVVYLIVFALTYNYVDNKQSQIKDRQSALAKGLIQQFENLPKLGSPEFNSEYIMAKYVGGFKEAPVRITKFSDFECPACKMLSTILHKVAKKYDGKIAIQYFFYPLDNACNPAMEGPLHRHACEAAYMAACKPGLFADIEEDIFDHQAALSTEWIEKKAKELGVTECMKTKETKEKVLKYINAAKAFGVQSTPTFLLNGVKIEGVLPQEQLEILIDHILSQAK